jgi:Flp pilus assembly protein TadG
MMKKLNNRGTAAWEFILVFVPLFMLIFVIFDLGRYAITIQSLQTLADAGARDVMVKCYTPDVTKIPKVSPSGCTSYTPLVTAAAKQAVAPFLYFGGLTPTLNPPSVVGNTLKVTASQTGFAMLMPIWNGKLDAPSASTSIPF